MLKCFSYLQLFQMFGQITTFHSLFQLLRLFFTLGELLVLLTFFANFTGSLDRQGRADHNASADFILQMLIVNLCVIKLFTRINFFKHKNNSCQKLMELICEGTFTSNLAVDFICLTIFKCFLFTYYFVKSFTLNQLQKRTRKLYFSSQSLFDQAET